MSPRLLDLFCGAGGASRGYHDAGFAVVGVDDAEQPNYPFEFVQADALDCLAEWEALELLYGPFDAIHASPPCQAHVQWNNLNEVRYQSRVPHLDLIPETRDLLQQVGLPYVIENVVGAPLRSSIMLCGSHFGLGVRRHRLFESNALLLREPGCSHSRNEVAVYGKLDGRRIWTREDGSEVRAARTLDEAREAMGIGWMTWAEIKEAIPPAYTEFIGRQLVQHALEAVA